MAQRRQVRTSGHHSLASPTTTATTTERERRAAARREEEQDWEGGHLPHAQVDAVGPDHDGTSLPDRGEDVRGREDAAAATDPDANPDSPILPRKRRKYRKRKVNHAMTDEVNFVWRPYQYRASTERAVDSDGESHHANDNDEAPNHPANEEDHDQDASGADDRPARSASPAPLVSGTLLDFAIAIDPTTNQEGLLFRPRNDFIRRGKAHNPPIKTMDLRSICAALGIKKYQPHPDAVPKSLTQQQCIDALMQRVRHVRGIAAANDDDAEAHFQNDVTPHPFRVAPATVRAYDPPHPPVQPPPRLRPTVPATRTRRTDDDDRVNNVPIPALASRSGTTRERPTLGILAAAATTGHSPNSHRSSYCPPPPSLFELSQSADTAKVDLYRRIQHFKDDCTPDEYRAHIYLSRAATTAAVPPRATDATATAPPPPEITAAVATTIDDPLIRWHLEQIGQARTLVDRLDAAMLQRLRD